MKNEIQGRLPTLGVCLLETYQGLQLVKSFWSFTCQQELVRQLSGYRKSLSPKWGLSFLSSIMYWTSGETLGQGWGEAVPRICRVITNLYNTIIATGNWSIKQHVRALGSLIFALWKKHGFSTVSHRCVQHLILVGCSLSIYGNDIIVCNVWTISRMKENIMSSSWLRTQG